MASRRLPATTSERPDGWAPYQPRPGAPGPGRIPLRQLLRWQGALADALVRLEPVARAEVVEEIDRLDATLLGDHPRAVRSALRALLERRPAAEPQVRRLRTDHAMFQTSLEQLRWFFQVVDEAPHGGNRQALGQYWRVVLEALDRHLTEEERLLG